MLRIRPHHIVCLRLFEGRGYDEAFTARMREVYDLMKAKPETRFALVSGADDLCAACPFGGGDQTCALGEEDVRNRDENARKALGLAAGERVSFAEVYARLAERMDEAAFETVCGGCRWKEKDICNYEKLKKP